MFFPFTGFLLNTMLAAGTMSLSSGFVLTNSLRLRRFKADGKNWATATMNEGGAVQAGVR